MPFFATIFAKIFGNPAFTITAVLSLLFAVVYGYASHEEKRARVAEQSVSSLEDAIKKVNAQAAADRAAQITKQKVITDAEENDLRAKLTLALDRLHASAGAGHTVSGSVPSDAHASGNPAGAGQAAVVDADAAICTEAVIKAQGWQDWYAKASGAFSASPEAGSDNK
jgi:hypothetical protein